MTFVENEDIFGVEVFVNLRVDNRMGMTAGDSRRRIVKPLFRNGCLIWVI